MDSKKKIAEIREKYNRTFGNVTGQMVLTHEQVQFLLSKLDREREENRKLLEERDEARRKAEEAWKEIDSLEQLREERDKLIEGLRWYAEGWIDSRDEGQRAREILKEIGVTVE